MASLVDRMVRAAKLDVSLYEEVEADKGSMGQAITVVVLSSIAGGIGSIGVFGNYWVDYRYDIFSNWLVYLGIPGLHYRNKALARASNQV